MALATLLLGASCSNEELTNGTSGDAVVTLKAQLPTGLQTKAIGDGLTATTLSYAVYAAGSQTPLLTSEDEVTFTNGQATLSLRLAAGRSYDFLFWADAYDADASNKPYTLNFNTQELTVDYTNALSNEEARDAFYGKATVEVKGAVTTDVALKRPFAQLNIGTDDMDDAAATGLATGSLKSSVKVQNVYKTLNLMSGEVGGDAEVTFAANDLPDGTFTANGTEYDYLALNYLLVAADKALVNCEFTYTDGSVTQTQNVSNVPVQRNYRTNIFGSLLTGAVDLNITIDPAFVDNHNYAELLLAAQNGGKVTLTEDVTLDAPLVVAEGKTLTVNLNGHDIINQTQAERNGMMETIVFEVKGNSELNIEGDGEVKAIEETADDDGYRMAVYAYGNAIVNIKGGSFYNYQKANAQLDLIYADQNAIINISGGKFESGCYSERSGKTVYWVLNKQDQSASQINVSGGTFVNFNPADSQTEPNNGANFVIDGYSSVKVSEEPTPNGTYQVVKGTGVATEADLNAAITSGASLITLAKDVALTSPLTFSNDVEIVADGEAKLTGAPVYFSAENVTVKGVTFANGKNATSNGSAIYVTSNKCKNLVLEDCVFNDAQWDGIQLTDKDIESVVFRNCTFKNTTAGNRYIHLELRNDGAYFANPTAQLEITGCTFENVSKTYCKDSAITILGFSLSNMTIENNIVKGDGANALSTSVIWICDGKDFSELMSLEDIKTKFVAQ